MAQETQHTERDALTDLIELALEAQRFVRVYERLINKIPAEEQQRFVGSGRFFVRKVLLSLEAHGIQLVSFDGAAFDPGWPVSVVNGDELPDTGDFIVDQTLEPAVTGPDGLIRMGTVVLRERSGT